MSSISKKSTCAFTGHRAIPKNFNSESIKEAIMTMISKGYDTFLVGMALGFDSLCFTILEKIRKNRNIRIIACVPCRDQNKYFNKKQTEEYLRMLKSADEVIVLSETYTIGCMQKRNFFMVDNSSCVIAYLTHTGGGTYTTVKYAKEKNSNVIYVGN